MANPFSLPWLAIKARRPRRIASIKAVKDSFWLGKKYDAMMFFGVIVTHTQHDADIINSCDNSLKRHETIHLLQARSTHNSWLCFYTLYIWYYLRALPMNRKLPNAAYRLNPFEMEAYEHMYNADYVEQCQAGANGWRTYAKMSVKERARMTKR